MDRLVAQHVICQNLWEVEFDKYLSRPDVSRYGTYQRLFLEHLDGQPFKYSPGWVLPQSGILALCFSSTRRVTDGPYSVEKLVDDYTFRKMITAYIKSPCSGEQKIQVMRKVSVKFGISIGQLLEVLKEEPDLDLRRDLFSTLWRRTLNVEENLGTIFERERSKIQGLLPLRHSDRVMLEHSFGRLAFYTPVTAKDMRFTLQLSVFEDRQILLSLLALSRRVPPPAFINVRFGPDESNMREYDIPKGWHEAIPDQGVIAATYVGQVPREFALELEKTYVCTGLRHLEHQPSRDPSRVHAPESPA